MQTHEVSGVARPHQPATQPIVLHRVHASGAEHSEERDAMRHRTGTQLVDVARHQVIRMLVVAAEHARLRMVVQQRPEFLEILCRRAFADEDFLAERKFFQCLVDLTTLVVGLDARLDIGLQICSAQSGRVPIDPLAVTLRNRELFHHHGIAMHDSRKIHHFRESDQRRVAAQFLDVCRPKHRSRRFKFRRRHARRNSKMNLQWRPLRFPLHVSHPVDPKHIGDLMRIGDRPRGAMNHRNPPEFRRSKHRAFDMHMRINKARTQVARFRHPAILEDFLNAAPAHHNHSRKNPPRVEVNDPSAVP